MKIKVKSALNNTARSCSSSQQVLWRHTAQRPEPVQWSSARDMSAVVNTKMLPFFWQSTGRRRNVSSLPERLKVRINAGKRRLPRRWTLSKSLLFFSSPPSSLLNFCFSLFSSAGGFWSLSEWQVWAFALRKGYRHFQTAKFTSGGDIRQNDTLAHTSNRSNSREEFSVIFWFATLAVCGFFVFFFLSNF